MKYNENGLNTNQVLAQQNKYGKNSLVKQKKELFIIKLFHIIIEPMFLLLIIAAIIYFLLGEAKDGIIMLIFVLGMIGIDVIEEWKTDKTLNALKILAAPKITVIRNGNQQEINSEDLVPGDLMILHEGVKIPADGYVVKNNGLLVDESTLTGETTNIYKKVYTENSKTNEYFRDDYCYAGTLVTSGMGLILVDTIGSKTEYGKIGTSIANTKEEKTSLEKQTDTLVKNCAIIAFVLFIFVGLFTYLNLPDHTFKARIIESILSGVTLAMAMIPEEFPVVLTVFLSMGAWRLAKKHSLVKKMSTVESLGTVSVLCVDKTGTITKNEMDLQNIWAKDISDKKVLEIMGMACLENSFDPMEKAMLKKCYEYGITKETLFNNEIIVNYPFTNETNMMGKIVQMPNNLLLVCKGSPESIINISNLTNKEKQAIEEEINIMSKEGLRVIGVASKKLKNQTNIKESLNHYELEFDGLVGLIDPPRDNIISNINTCKQAGIRVVMITGDNGLTASSIAKKIGIPNSDLIITGHDLDLMSDSELSQKVNNTNIFSRVTPEHKMRIVKALKENGEVVAMTGDGVNDAPALKYSDIGIAMGKRGSEVSREAANLILLDDNFSTIVDTIADGRRIYDNIKRAIEYIFVIHIPIALSSLLAPLLNINPKALLLLPVHVVLLEIIIDPTCSIVLERQPPALNIMARPPRNKNAKILNFHGLTKSILQGLFIFIISFLAYYFILQNTNNINLARTVGLIIIMLANLFLVQVNSSDTNYVYQTTKYLLKDKVMWIINIATILGIILISYSPLNHYLRLAPLPLNYLLLTILLAFISVFWYEIVKLLEKHMS